LSLIDNKSAYMLGLIIGAVRAKQHTIFVWIWNERDAYIESQCAFIFKLLLHEKQFATAMWFLRSILIEDFSSKETDFNDHKTEFLESIKRNLDSEFHEFLSKNCGRSLTLRKFLRQHREC